MKLINIILLLVLVSFAVGQDPADRPVEIRNVDVAPVGEQVKIEVTLTQPVVPTVIVATNPDRLVLELPNTSSSAKQQRATVNQGGVKMVRIGLNSTNPPVTRVVLDLVEPRLYELATDGKKVTLTLLAPETARQRKGAPVPAATGTLLGKLHHEAPENLPTTARAPAPVTPPPSLPPIKTPAAQSNPPSGTTTASTSRPSAANPNFGSLQQGTVSPNTGTPGQGVVPGRNSSSANTGLALTKPEAGFPEVAVVHGDRMTPVDQKQASTPKPQPKAAQPATTPAPSSAGAKTVQPVQSAANKTAPVIASSTSTAQSKAGAPATQPLQATPAGSLTAKSSVPATPAQMKSGPAPQSQKPPAVAPSSGATVTSATTPQATTAPVASKQVPLWEQPAFPPTGSATSASTTTVVASKQEAPSAPPARVPVTASATRPGTATAPVASKQVPLWARPETGQTTAAASASGAATTPVAPNPQPPPAPARVPVTASATRPGTATAPVASKQVPLWARPETGQTTAAASASGAATTPVAPNPQPPPAPARVPVTASATKPGTATAPVKQVPLWEQPAFPTAATSGNTTAAVASKQEAPSAQAARVPTTASATRPGTTATPVASKQVPLWEQPAFPGASTSTVVSSSATSANPATAPQTKVAAQPTTAVTATAKATAASAAPPATQAGQAPAAAQPSLSNNLPQVRAGVITGTPPTASIGSAEASKKTPAPPQSAKPTLVASAAPAPGPAKPDLETQVPVLLTRPSNSDIRVSYKVKYVAEGVAYLDGGRASGLAEGTKLIVLDKDPFLAQPTAAAVPSKSIVAELQVTAVADSSSVADIHTPKRDLKSGDLAFLSSDETEAMVAQRSLSATRKYPSVVSFTQSDTLDEEARAEVPRPPLPEVNRARGRLGFDYSGMMSHGATPMTSSNFGLVVRTDITRIYGTYWNLSGFWRGRLTSTNSSQTSLQDLINRTYHLGLTYDNPRSPFVAGFGRLYLPWATSLDTIDGGYVGGRIGRTILGVFAGSTPDPSSYSYNPNQRIAGSFVNISGGSFDSFRYSSTSGVGLSMLKWAPNRPFVFAENGLYYKRFLGIYHAFQADNPKGNAVVQAPGAGVGRSFLTVRLQPHERIEFDLNHNYFRDIPTFDLTLVGTTLLDKYLFQGYSAGTRVEVIRQVWLYTTLGKSSRSGDPAASLNQLYGVTFGRVPWTGVRADLHYSKFNSSFGRGFYEAISLSRNIRDSFHGELLAGRQSFVSTLAASNTSKFVTANLDTNVGRHYFFMGGFTWNRGGVLNYDQWYLSLGYRFDSKFKGQ